MHRRVLIVSVAVLIGAAAACSGGGSDGGDHMGSGSGTMSGHGPMHGGGAEESRPVVPDARVVRIVGDDFSFDPDAITIAAGEDVTIELTARDIEHDVKVEGAGHVVHAEGGGTEQGGLRIPEAGTYEFWCSIPGHRAAGMEGTVTVT